MSYVDRVVTVDKIRHRKLRADVYLHAAKTMQVEPRDLALVAAHARDIRGAGRAGLTTGFVSRKVFPASYGAA